MDDNQATSKANNTCFPTQAHQCFKRSRLLTCSQLPTHALLLTTQASISLAASLNHSKKPPPRPRFFLKYLYSNTCVTFVWEMCLGLRVTALENGIRWHWSLFYLISAHRKYLTLKTKPVQKSGCLTLLFTLFNNFLNLAPFLAFVPLTHMVL